MGAQQTQSGTRLWRRVLRPVAGFTAGCAVALTCWVVFVRWNAAAMATVTVFDRVCYTAMIVGFLASWFGLGALLAGAFARSGKQVWWSAVVAGVVTACVSWAAVHGLVPPVVGGLLGPVVCGMLVGRLSWRTATDMGAGQGGMAHERTS